MILLDTNVVSELRKVQQGRADRAVAEWVADHALADLHLSALTILELELGILRVLGRDPVQAGHLRRWFDDSVLPAFGSRILPVDKEVARVCARLQASRTLPYADSLIAATALAHDLALATRNVRDFDGTGVRLLNPWASGS